jgi:hypothetical protein
MLLTHVGDKSRDKEAALRSLVITGKTWLQLLLSLHRLVRAIHVEKVFDGR